MTACACGCGTPLVSYRAEYVKGHRPTAPLADRLWSRVDKSGECWEWIGYRNRRGYGEIGIGRPSRVNMATHRAAWMLTFGEIPPGLVICHRCDNPPCCRPDHLFLGSRADNNADMRAKGREARGLRLPQAKLSDADVAAIRARYVQRYSTNARGGYISNAAELAAEYGIATSYACAIANGMYRKAVA